MTTISLGGSQWLSESTAAWKAEQAKAASQERQAANVQEAPALRYEWPIERLHRKGQLDDDFFIASILHATAMRFHTDWHLSRGRESEVQRERLASFNAANAR
jgi:hypothetical protein